jgi:hypothetical protein
MLVKGYIHFGQYDGERETSSGKKVTQFSLSMREGGERRYLNHITAWHDGAIEREIIDGRYVVLDVREREWERGGKSGTDYTVNSVWLRADGYDGLENKPAGGSGKTVENVYEDIDIPF